MSMHINKGDRMAMNDVKYLSCHTSQTIGVLTFIHNPLYQSPNPLHANLSRQVTSHYSLGQTLKLKNGPRLLQKRPNYSLDTILALMQIPILASCHLLISTKI